jgi:hypothetical protein
VRSMLSVCSFANECWSLSAIVQYGM